MSVDCSLTPGCGHESKWQRPLNERPPVDYDFTFAGIFQGLISSRPDDQFGAGIVFTTTNDAVITLLEDTEFGFELYYTLMLGDGKIQVTPHLIYVMDPGGGEFPGGAFVEDALFILGVRMYVPF